MTSFLISAVLLLSCFFFFSSRRRHTRCSRDWSSDVCSSDLTQGAACNSGTTCMQNWAQWNVYYAESVNGHDAPPSFVQSVISDHVIHRGTISTGGLGGGADRSLTDLFQVAFDPQHFANVAFSDDHKV